MNVYKWPRSASSQIMFNGIEVGIGSEKRSIPLENLSEFLLKLTDRVTAIEKINLEANSTSTMNESMPLGISQASEILRLSKSRIYVLSSQGKIPHHKRGGRLYFFKEELFGFIKYPKSFTVKKVEAL